MLISELKILSMINVEELIKNLALPGRPLKDEEWEALNETVEQEETIPLEDFVRETMKRLKEKK